MNLPFYIGRRYLFSKKSHNAINIISFISVCGITIATMALVCTLSVFNGFEDMVSKMFNSYDPDLNISPAKGKVFDKNIPTVQKAIHLDEVAMVVESLEENALLKYGDKQAPVLVKGVSDNFSKAVDDKKLLVKGDFNFRQGDIDYAAMGIGLASKLDAHREFITPLELYAPIRDVKVNLANPAAASTTTYLYLDGVFSVNSSKLDESLLIVSLKVARETFHYDDNQASNLEIKLKNGTSSEKLKKKMREILGPDYLVQDRFEQQESTFKMMQIEKWVTFLILAFIAIIAIFNVIGSLTMLILEKEKDIATLRSLGARNNVIAGIFLVEGWMISFAGAAFGVILGVALCALQEHFGLLKLGGDSEQFIINAYPVKVQLADLLIIFSSVVFVGFLTVIFPVRSLSKKLSLM